MKSANQPSTAIASKPAALARAAALYREASEAGHVDAAVSLGVLYGLRRSEVLALRWDDLDVKANTLRIDESLVATNQGAASPIRPMS